MGAGDGAEQRRIIAVRLRTGFFGSIRALVSHPITFFAFLLVVPGVIALVVGITNYDAAQPIAGGRATTGTIIAVNTGQNCDRYGCSTYWVATIQFTANGEDFTFAGPESSKAMTTGGQVQVSYDPSNPAVAHDLSADVGNARTDIWIGAVLIPIAVGGFLLGFRRRRSALLLIPVRAESGWIGRSGSEFIRGIFFLVVASLVAIFIVQLVVH